jgi:two-component system, NarL family, nitrate/nitrite response regulator NarL
MDTQPEAGAVSSEIMTEVWPGWTPRHAARIRLMLIDDHLLIREGIEALLSLERDLEVVGTASSIPDGIELARALSPDLVISDLTFPGCNGSTAVRTLCQACPETRVLVLSVHDSLECIRAAFAAGAVGYLRKDASREEMLYAVRRAVAGGRSTCLAVGDIVVQDWLERGGLREPAANACLSAEDRRALRLIALGVPTWRIAEEFGRGVKTVEKYRASLMRRLSLKNTAAVTRFAVDMHLLSHSEVDRLLAAGAVSGSTAREAL